MPFLFPHHVLSCQCQCLPPSPAPVSLCRPSLPSSASCCHSLLRHRLLFRPRRSHFIGEPARRRTLENLGLPLHQYRGILILSDERYEDNAVKCDSHSLSALLMVGDMLTEKPEELDESVHRGVVTEVGQPWCWRRRLLLSSCSQPPTLHVSPQILDLRTQESVRNDKAIKGMGDFMMSRAPRLGCCAVAFASVIHYLWAGRRSTP